MNQYFFCHSCSLLPQAVQCRLQGSPSVQHCCVCGWGVCARLLTLCIGSLLDLHGSFHNSKHCKLDHTDLVSSEAKSGNVFTKAFVGGVPCDIVDDNLELCDTLTREKVTCRSKAKLVGPMNVTVCVTGRGASEVTKIGRPSLADLLGGFQDPSLAFKTLNHTRVFLQQLTRI
ncbi:uncharacterized protein LOC135104988 isoform X5 [Scylla paramamosain]|uniref:uncharacterized protein LOC135097700 isoform X1 n=1 Tax=Scylla paramamosain TaxID=85552 RepID=UPI003083EA96